MWCRTWPFWFEAPFSVKQNVLKLHVRCLSCAHECRPDELLGWRSAWTTRTAWYRPGSSVPYKARQERQSTPPLDCSSTLGALQFEWKERRHGACWCVLIIGPHVWAAINVCDVVSCAMLPIALSHLTVLLEMPCISCCHSLCRLDVVHSPVCFR